MYRLGGELPCSRIYILGETYLSRSPMYYSARAVLHMGVDAHPGVTSK